MTITKTIAAAMIFATPFAAHAQQTDSAAATATESPDPARLTLATKLAQQVMPEGIYRKMMKGVMDQVVDNAMDSMLDLPVRDLARIGGLSDEELSQMGEGTMREMMEIMDPAYDERTRRTVTAITDAMTSMMTDMEPTVREGLAEAYASHYTTDQLEKIGAFFDTPAGGRFAAQSMLIFTDPAIMKRMQAIMPKIMKQMPAVIEAAENATSDLPGPRDYDDLDAAERAKLAKLIGVSPDELEKTHQAD